MINTPNFVRGRMSRRWKFSQIRSFRLASGFGNNSTCLCFPQSHGSPSSRGWGERGGILTKYAPERVLVVDYASYVRVVHFDRSCSGPVENNRK